jgi:DNA replication protein DnaC
MSDAPKILLADHLKTLKLPTFLREYDKLARQCAAEGQDHVQFLTRLVELELIDRERRMIERRIKAAKFPATKSLDSFDFKAIPKLNKMQVLELARCDWIERRENVIALGPSGTGKTHVALGLGLAASLTGAAEAAFWFVAISMFVSGAVLFWLGDETHPRLNPASPRKLADA